MLSIENKPPALNNSMVKRYLYCSIDLDIMTLINMTMAKYKKDQTCLGCSQLRTNHPLSTIQCSKDICIVALTLTL